MHRSACCKFFCKCFFRRYAQNFLTLRASKLLRLHDTCTDSATIASIAAFGCHNGLYCDYRAYLDDNLLCCRRRSRRRLRKAATRANPSTLFTDNNPTAARALSACRVIHRSVCCFFFCFFFRHNFTSLLTLSTEMTPLTESFRSPDLLLSLSAKMRSTSVSCRAPARSCR